MQIVEVKTTLDGLRRRFTCDVVARSDEVLVVLYRHARDAVVHGLVLPAGTLSVGYFWPARPYNVYHWLRPDGATIAHYVNVGDVTAYELDRIEWRDLAVDVLATPDGRVRVLDEDELPPDLDPALRRHVEQARDRVLAELPALVAETEPRSRAIAMGDAGAGA